MHCRYHNRHDAAWHCDHCQLALCTTCIPGGETNFRPGQPHCPTCLKSLRWHGVKSDKPPFWQAAPQLFRYPAKPALLTMALFAGLAYGSFFLLELIVLVIAVRYGLQIIASMAEGRDKPPPLANAISGDISPFFRQMGALVIMLAAPLLLYLVSPAVSMAAQVLVAIAVPANIMLLAVTGSLRSSLNPFSWLRMIWAIGAPYILLWFALVSVQSAPHLLQYLGMPVQGIAGTIVGFINFYSWMVCFAMMGYLLQEQGDKFDFGFARARGKDLPLDEFARRSALGSSHIYAQQGNIADALKVINQALASWPADAALNERKYRLLRLKPDSKTLPLFAEEYMRLQLAMKNPGAAVATFLDMRSLQPAFLPEAPDTRLALATQLFERGRWKDAAALLVNLHSSHPQFSSLAEAYLLLARIYLEGFGRRDNAEKVIGFLRQRFPASLQSEEGMRLLAAAELLRAT